MLADALLGLLRPPVAASYSQHRHRRGSIERATRAVIRFYGVPVLVLLLITFVPALVMTLPRLLGA